MLGAGVLVLVYIEQVRFSLFTSKFWVGPSSQGLASNGVCAEQSFFFGQFMRRQKIKCQGPRPHPTVLGRARRGLRALAPTLSTRFTDCSWYVPSLQTAVPAHRQRTKKSRETRSTPRKSAHICSLALHVDLLWCVPF